MTEVQRLHSISSVVYGCISSRETNANSTDDERTFEIDLNGDEMLRKQRPNSKNIISLVVRTVGIAHLLGFSSSEILL